MKKTIVFLDMDGPLANFDAAVSPGDRRPDPLCMYEPGFFRNLAVVAGAKEGVAALLANPELKVFIGSKPVALNPHSAKEKMEWIQEHFPELTKRIMLTCDKGLLRGDVLIDDDKYRWEKRFVGRFYYFDKADPVATWAAIVREFGKKEI